MEESSTKEYVYGIYVRKSSEGEDRQVQSLDRQLVELKEYVQKNNLTIYPEIFEEEQSAFHPGREQFGRLVSLTEKGEINAWLCWHYNRLSRNPIDAGTVVYLMDQGKLNHVRTREKTFWNTAGDKFILNLELSISKKDSDDKSHIIRSGIRQRNRRGYPTGKAPVGFVMRNKGVQGVSGWIVDSKRFPLLQKVFNRFLKGEDSIRSITEYAKQIGLTTAAKGSKEGNHPLSISHMHNHLLKNPVYAGHFFGKDGKRYMLHEDLPRILSEEDLRRISQILADRSNGHVKKRHEATYCGKIKSPDGRNLSADLKFQLICDCKKKFCYRNREVCPGCGVKIERMKKPKYLEYTYYYDYQARIDKSRIAKTIEEKKLEKALTDFFAKNLNISKSLRDWSMKYLSELEDSDIEEHTKLHRQLSKKFSEIENRKMNIKDLLMDGLISKDEYSRKLGELEEGTRELKKNKAAEKHGNGWLEEAELIYDMAVEFGNIMKFGDPKAKKQAVDALTSNLTWDGEKLSIRNGNPVSHLIFGLEIHKEELAHFEPTKIVANTGRKGCFEDMCPAWCTHQDEFRTLIFREKMKVVDIKIGGSEVLSEVKRAA